MPTASRHTRCLWHNVLSPSQLDNADLLSAKAGLHPSMRQHNMLLPAICASPSVRHSDTTMWYQTCKPVNSNAQDPTYDDRGPLAQEQHQLKPRAWHGCVAMSGLDSVSRQSKSETILHKQGTQLLRTAVGWPAIFVLLHELSQRLKPCVRGDLRHQALGSTAAHHVTDGMPIQCYETSAALSASPWIECTAVGHSHEAPQHRMEKV
jgi:hypothetical protein